jgi:hypothetical protein
LAIGHAHQRQPRGKKFQAGLRIVEQRDSMPLCEECIERLLRQQGILARAV